MPTIITSTQKKFQIFPQNKKTFTTDEITERIGGLTQPLFLGSIWIFHNVDGLRLGMDYNVEASRLLKIPLPSIVCGNVPLTTIFPVPV